MQTIFLEIKYLENYNTYQLDNGLRVIHLHQESSVSYCGVIVNAGSRDEKGDELGMAHFIEHMLFKGTSKRRSSQIINRLEDVGGELNAYTSKEETVLYAGFLSEYTERTIELISDLIQHSVFPESEVSKELVVIQDEIKSYKDIPSELIYDDFEEMLFDSNPMSHNVLGKSEILDTFTSGKALEFYHTYYQPENMVFFSLGSTDMQKIVKWVSKYFHFHQKGTCNHVRIAPEVPAFEKKIFNRDTHQVHCLIGARAYDIYHPERMTMYLLNNILGGPGMNSLLNLSLRERNGLVYSVESTFQSFTDCGWWGVYFGTDPENVRKCEKLVIGELAKLCENKISESKLKKYKLQLMGQLAIAAENKENMALSLGKSYLRYGKFDNNEQIRKKIEAITPERMLLVAREIFDVNKLSVLKYT